MPWWGLGRLDVAIRTFNYKKDPNHQAHRKDKRDEWDFRDDHKDAPLTREEEEAYLRRAIEASIKTPAPPLTRGQEEADLRRTIEVSINETQREEADLSRAIEASFNESKKPSGDASNGSES
jgi:hypothetical protein